MTHQCNVFFTFYITNAKSETVNCYSYWNSLLFTRMSGNLSDDSRNQCQSVNGQLRSGRSDTHAINHAGYSPLTRDIQGKVRWDMEIWKSRNQLGT